MEALQITWFVLWSVLWAAYFMLDGFVLGTGMLHRTLSGSETERKVLIHSVGPVWSGNEVWLVTAAGATFAAFPTAYALMFSNLYSALFILLFALILRGASLELRDHTDSASGKSAWDTLIVISSLLITVLFGVAFGNIFQGLPMDAMGYHGGLVSLLNPYGLITGVLFVLLFIQHGALYTCLKSDGGLCGRAQDKARLVWPFLLIITATFLVYTAFATGLYDNYLSRPVLFLLPLMAVAALAAVRIFLAQGRPGRAFTASSLLVVMIVFSGMAGLFPNLIPSSLDPVYSVTIFNASASRLTLVIMTGVAVVFVPIVILYKIWVYRIFSGQITEQDIKGEEGY